MKIKYQNNYNKNYRLINFYLNDFEKKVDNEKEIFLNFKIEEDIDLIKFIKILRRLIQRVKSHSLERVSFDYEKIKNLKVKNLSEEDKAVLFVETLLVAEYKFDRFVTEKKGRIKEILIFNFNKKEKELFKKGEKIAESINFSRELSNLPGSFLTPDNFIKEIKKEFSNNKNIKIKILKEKEIKKEGLGLLEAVGRGSEEKSRLLILEYMPEGKKIQPAVLVGKGVTFDTGGYNIKVDKHMLGMHMDMSGASVVAGALKLLSNLEIKKNLVVLIPLAENMVSEKALKPGDILKSYDGMTVEVLNTDAEGRLILADAISYSKKFNPKFIIDVATLTGAALVALGQKASALMTNNEVFGKEIISISEKNYERIWMLPAWDEFYEDIKSDKADIANLSKTIYGGSITAAVFLKKFAEKLKIDWAHIDIAPRMESEPGDFLEKGATGEPIKTLTRFIENN